jgi:hypothetical protein
MKDKVYNDLIVFFRNAQYALTKNIEYRGRSMNTQYLRLMVASEWFEYVGQETEPFSVYLRGNHAGKLTIASIEGKHHDPDLMGEHQKGRMPKVLRAVEFVSNGPVTFECVVNPMIANWLSKNQYTFKSDGSMMCCDMERVYENHQ